jgi:outer membrane protein assembly factor BamB
MRSIKIAGITSLLMMMTTFGAIATPAIVLEPPRASPGDPVRVRADGFTADAIVDVYLDDVDRVVARTDAEGHLDAVVELPVELDPGTHWVTAVERRSERVVQARLRVDVFTTWTQVGDDPGRTGAAPPEARLSRTLLEALNETWYRDLEVLEPDEEIFVTDAAGEVATPAVVDGTTVISTWYATDVMSEDRVFRRVALTSTDLMTGRVRWRLVAESTDWRDLSFGTPVLTGGVVVTRWDGDRTLLGLDPTTGDVRWRYRVPEHGRIGELLSAGDRVIAPIERPGEDDQLMAIDPDDGRLVWEGSLPNGSGWQLAAGADLVVAAGTPDHAIGLDASDGTTRWMQHLPIARWGGPIVAEGWVLLPSLEDGSEPTATALRLASGRQGWAWNPWPDGSCGQGCEILWAQAGPGSVADQAVLVGATAGYCPPSRPATDCDASPSIRSVLTALDTETGHELWSRRFEGTIGQVSTSDEVAIVVVARDPIPGVVVGGSGLRILDLQTGEALMTIPPPRHPNTYGAQQSWAGQAIPTGSRLVVGAADGTVTVFSVVTETARPDPTALRPDPALPVPLPASTSVPTTTVAPEPEDRSAAAWLAIVVTGLALMAIGVGVAAVMRRRSTKPGPHHTEDRDTPLERDRIGPAG